MTGRILNFLKATWNAITLARSVALNLIFLALVIGLLVVVFRDRTPPSDGGVLVLAPKGFIVEEAEYQNPLDKLIPPRNSNFKPPEVEAGDLIRALDEAADDDDIQAVLLDLREMQGGELSLIADLAGAMEKFRQAGKKIYFYGEQIGQYRYYLAAHADEIYLHPQGFLMFLGFGTDTPYLKDALDNLKVRVNLFRVGEYKSALEPLVRNDMSREAREATQSWLNDRWQLFTSAVEKARDLTPGTIQRLADDLPGLLEGAGGQWGKLALEQGLVDEILTRGAFRKRMIEVAGARGDSFRQIHWEQYLEARPNTPESDHKDRIALILASGQILPGEQEKGTIGADTLSKRIRKARKDDSVRAIVLRVNSPGGSAFASELVYNELQSARRQGKPVVTSMGNVAASGGYYLAAASDLILASPLTITGSIGIFAAFPTFEKALDHLGIHFDGAKTAELTDAWSGVRQLAPGVARIIQADLGAGYERFLQVVAEGRGMTRDQVDKIARGRVWLAPRALELGLVDRLGGLQDAIEAAAGLAKLEDYGIREFRHQLTPFEKFIGELDINNASGPLNTDLIHRAYRRLFAVADILAGFQDPKGLYLRCLECEAR